MLNRREFMSLVSAGVAANLITGKASASTNRQAASRAVVFDAFPIFDPRPVFARVEELFPGRGSELSNAWRTRQFEYQWLRALSGQYADFRQATEDALIFSAKLNSWHHQITDRDPNDEGKCRTGKHLRP